MRSFMFLALVAIPALSAQAVLPTEWIDAGTGHRVIRLSREDGTQSLYFNQNAYTADGKKLIVTTAGGGIATITLATREVKPLVAGPCRCWLPVTRPAMSTSQTPAGRAWRRGWHTQHQRAIVYAANVDTGAARGSETAAGAKCLVPECR
jgi:oligogalacturonide lyase